MLKAGDLARREDRWVKGVKIRTTQRDRGISNVSCMPVFSKICDLLKATTNSDWGTLTGDLSAQSPRLYHCASPLHSLYLSDLCITK